MINVSVVIPAAGIGKRMKSHGPKANIKNTYTISISDIESELTGINDPVSFTKYKSQLNLRLQERKLIQQM